MEDKVTGLVLSLLVASLQVMGGQCGVIGAAAGGAAGAAAGAGTSDQTVTGATLGRNVTMDIITMVVLAAFALGAISVGVVKIGIKVFRKFVLKIPELPRSFVMDRKVKCKSGHNMMLFHVPRNVSDYILCGSESACHKKKDLAGFTAWYSCPVCSYRICSGCAALDVADSARRDKNSLEILLARQFVNFGKNMKRNSPVESSIPGQVQ